jgi:hypothetical protein
MEIWNSALGFENLYEVSNFGNVRRIARSKTLNASKIPEAKQMFEQGATLKEVADFLSTSITTAHSIKLGKTWAGNEGHRAVKPRLNRTFYMTVDFCRDGKYTKKQVHRIVWEAFYGEIPGRLEINHKNLNRSDNRLDNLELLTHKENLSHAHAIYAEKRKHLPKGQRQGPRSSYAKIKHD